MSARAAPASMTTRHKAAHRIADRVLFNFLLSLYGRSRLNRNANRRPQCGDRSGGVFRKCSPPRLSPEADGSGGDSSPRGSGWGVFRKRYRPRPARKRGIPARKGRAGGNCGSVICRVRLRRLARRHHRRGLHRSRRRNGCRRRSCRRNDRRSRRRNGCRRSCRRNGR